jgi:hypothetical protein
MQAGEAAILGPLLRALTAAMRAVLGTGLDRRFLPSRAGGPPDS